jgi:diguanylate cyclase (GGDEF)-like protein
MLGMTIDVTEQHQQQRRLQHLAHFDPLTGLPNRILLADRMKQAMAHADRTGDLLGVVYLDLDGFKPVNDRLGHSAGDELLRKIAERLPRAMRGEDSVARMGGDEFVLLLSAVKDMQDCELAMQRAMAAISEGYWVAGEQVQVTASMGATLYPQDASDADTLLRHADQAMYIAKQAGRNRYHFFDPHQALIHRSQQERHERLAQALRTGEFVLYVQPRVNMRTGQVLGAEALARWQHPEQGVLPPAQFLPEIEASDLNTEFGQWVIQSAMVLLAQWQSAGLPQALSINITARHLQNPQFCTQLAQALAAHPTVQPGQLEIEVTESGSLSDLDSAVVVIQKLHKMGIQVSLDDFGTGYSSLTYLRRLPVDTLKIDQSFVRDMLTDTDDRAIVKGIIGLAESFGLDVVAEGVENPEQGHLLLQMGCDMAQGYGVARPMPQSEFAPWVGQWEGNGLWHKGGAP